MKTLILTQNVKDIDGMKLGLTKAQSLLYGIQFDISFEFASTTKQFTSIIVNSDVVHNGYEVNPQEIVDASSIPCDVTCLIYDWNFIYPHPTNPCTNLFTGEVPMQIPVNWYSDFTVTPNKTYPEVLTQFFLHELSHYVAWKTGQTDLTHYQPQNPLYSQKPPIDYYLYLISNLKQYMPPATYKYFKPAEIVGLQTQLVQMLDKARGVAGVPFKITSGFRTEAQNKAVGGKPNSSHLRGLAVDLSCDNYTRPKILRGLLSQGDAMFIEDAVKHIHVDLDLSIHSLGQMIVSTDE